MNYINDLVKTPARRLVMILTEEQFRALTSNLLELMQEEKGLKKRLIMKSHKGQSF